MPEGEPCLPTKKLALITSLRSEGGTPCLTP